MKGPKSSKLAQDIALQRSPKGDVSREQVWSNIPAGVCWVLVAGRSYFFLLNFLATSCDRWNHSSLTKDQGPGSQQWKQSLNHRKEVLEKLPL